MNDMHFQEQDIKYQDQYLRLYCNCMPICMT